MIWPCHIFGPNITDRDNRANAQFISNMLNEEDIVLKRTGTQMRSNCYIADSASAILTVLLNGQSGEAYNNANLDSRVMITEFAEVVAKEVGEQIIFADPNEKELIDQTPIKKTGFK